MLRRLSWSTTVLFLIVPPTAAAAQSKRPLDHSVYDGWRTVEASRMSNDGQWVVYSLVPQRGDAELQVRATRGNRQRVIARGVDARFTGDGRYVVFMIKPGLAIVDSARRAGAEGEDLPGDSLGILNLGSGDVMRVGDVESFEVADDAGAVLAYLMDEPVAEEDEGSGATLVFRNLANGVSLRQSNVTEYAFAANGSLLGVLRDGADNRDKGASAMDTGNGTVTVVAAGAGAYTSVVVEDDGNRMAFLTTRDDADADQPAYAVYVWDGSSDAARSVATVGDRGIPAGWWISEHRAPSFSDEGRRLMFGTAPRPAPAVVDSTPEDQRVKVDIWNWRDPLLQPMQLLQAQRERDRSYLAVLALGTERVVQLATADMPDVTIGRGGDAAVALGRSNLPYRQQISWDSPRWNDYYAVDVETGEREPVATRIQGSLSFSPDGRYAAWWDNVSLSWFTKRLSDGTVVEVTSQLAQAFHNEEHDWPYRPDAYGSAGWTDGDEEFLVYDRYDIWALSPDGRRAPRNVTGGAGRRDSVRYRYIRLDRDIESISHDDPMVLSMLNYHTKASGFARVEVRNSSEPRVLVLDAFRFGRPTRAADADVVMFTRESVVEYPNLWVSDLGFADARQVSDANPQQAEYRWARVEQFNWRSISGEPLQGLVYKPDDFDPSRKYPMIVYFYERNSNSLHAHHPAIPHRSVIRPTFYASRGYVVFIPDITYDVGYPGQSAMDDVIPGVLELIDQGYIDESNIGTQGHSWGGYQIAYMVTRTNLFKAAAGGAPVANMTSAYGGIRWASGMSRMFQYEKTQSRLGGTLWEAPLRYIENSPIFWADKVETPLLMMANDHDGAVPWEQGIEMFVALRRLGKPAWLVNYNDEPHWPTTYPNKVDWNIRMQQFFDHYLKGAPAPRWLAEGVPAVRKGEDLGYELVETSRTATTGANR